MNKYALRLVKDCKSNSIMKDVTFKVKKRVTKIKGFYYGTTYEITDNKLHKMRMYVHCGYDGAEDDPVIYIDRLDCFDKLLNCPIQLHHPKDEKEYQKLLIYIRSILIDDGWYYISNECITEKWVKKY